MTHLVTLLCMQIQLGSVPLFAGAADTKMLLLMIPLLVIVHLAAVMFTMRSSSSSSFASYFTFKFEKMCRHDSFKNGVCVVLCKMLFWASCRLGVCGVVCIILNYLTNNLYDDYGGCKELLRSLTIASLELTRYYQYLYVITSTVVLGIAAATIAGLNSKNKHMTHIYFKSKGHGIVQFFREWEPRYQALSRWRQKQQLADGIMKIDANGVVSLRRRRILCEPRRILYYISILAMTVCASGPSIMYILGKNMPREGWQVYLQNGVLIALLKSGFSSLVIPVFSKLLIKIRYPVLNISSVSLWVSVFFCLSLALCIFLCPSQGLARSSARSGATRLTFGFIRRCSV